ncbi:MAG TPA: radical SAM protein [Vicinamibacterales bacterium]|jgi:radical SAM protein with 4Fe4S-binding SPASM domain
MRAALIPPTVTNARSQILSSAPPLEWDAATRLIQARRTTLLVNSRGGNWIRLSGAGARFTRQMWRGEPGSLDVQAADASSEQRRRLIDTLLLGGFARPAGDKACGPATLPCAAPVRAAMLNVTRRCNLRCAHCGVCAGPARDAVRGDADSTGWADERPPARSFDPPAAQLYALVERMARAGVADLVLFGGEPLLHARFAEVLQCAARNVARVGVATNGTLLDAARCQAIAARVARVCVSLDGSRPEVHDAIRGAGTFQRTIDGILRLQALGGPALGIKAVIMRQNLRDVPNLVKLAGRLRLSLELTPVVARGRAGLAGNGSGVTAAELLTTYMRVWMLAEYYEVASASFNAFCDRYMSRAGVSCGAGAGSVLVDCDGTIFPCDGLQSSPYRLGNLLTDADSLSRRSLEPAVAGVDERPGCARCAVRYFCKGGCAADVASAEAGGRRASSLCQFLRLVLPRIAAGYTPAASSWLNLRRVFGGAVDFAMAEEYLP